MDDILKLHQLLLKFKVDLCLLQVNRVSIRKLIFDHFRIIFKPVNGELLRKNPDLFLKFPNKKFRLAWSTKEPLHKTYFFVLFCFAVRELYVHQGGFLLNVTEFLQLELLFPLLIHKLLPRNVVIHIWQLHVNRRYWVWSIVEHHRYAPLFFVDRYRGIYTLVWEKGLFHDRNGVYKLFVRQIDSVGNFLKRIAHNVNVYR